MQTPANGLPRIRLLGTGVKIALTAVHFHGFGVARQGPWNTWVNKGSWESLGISWCGLQDKCSRAFFAPLS
jgi:hypothetical protein